MNEITISDAEWTPLEVHERKCKAAEYSRRVRAQRKARGWLGRFGDGVLMTLWGSVLALLVG